MESSTFGSLGESEESSDVCSCRHLSASSGTWPECEESDEEDLPGCEATERPLRDATGRQLREATERQLREATEEATSEAKHLVPADELWDLPLTLDGKFVLERIDEGEDEERSCASSFGVESFARGLTGGTGLSSLDVESFTGGLTGLSSLAVESFNRGLTGGTGPSSAEVESFSREVSNASDEELAGLWSAVNNSGIGSGGRPKNEGKWL
ncbi:unnamed protein product, partial [Polarella glacialis]